MLVSYFLFFLLLTISKCDSSFENVRSKFFSEDPFRDCVGEYNNLTIIAEMIDSSSKLIPTGLISGNVLDLGFYDQCLSISDEKDTIHGKYCLTSLPFETIYNLTKWFHPHKFETDLNAVNEKLVKLEKTKLLGGNNSLSTSSIVKEFTFGLCVPDKCSAKALGKYSLLKFDDDRCYTKSTNAKMETGALVALSILGTILAIVVISTIYDIILGIYGKEPIHEICIAFSMYTNGRKLLKISTSSEQISCLNGIKTFSMIWVVLGHSYYNMILVAPINNYSFIKEWLDDPVNMLILSATVSVDTFFTMGGLLTVYVYMKSPESKLRESFKKIPFLYIHRYLRLTPALAIMVLLYGSGLIKYISDGPKWYSLNKEISNCAEHWWSTILYIQNYMSILNMCVGQTWYLSADFQLFLLTPFILIPLRKWPKYVIPSLYVLTLAGVVTPFYLGFSKKMSGIGTGSENPAFSNDYYFQTHTRFSTYVIGMIAGYYIYKVKKRSKPLLLDRRIVLLLWALSISGHLFCIFDGFSLVEDSSNQWLDGFYMGFNRSLWSLSVSLLIFLCCTGHGGPINDFLSLPVFQVVAKLSYSMYLIHYIVIVITFASSRTAYHMSNFQIISVFLTQFLITLVLSVFYTLFFESPMIIIEKVIFSNMKKR